MRTIFCVVLILFCGGMGCGVFGVPSCKKGTIDVEGGVRSGSLTQSENWSGEILVTGDIDLGKNCVLTILPGTVIRFQADSDDQASGRSSPFVDSAFPNDPPKKESELSGIRLLGGTLKAVGTSESPILFTSSSPNPVAGDWHSIELRQSGHLELSHVVIEYAYQGVQLSRPGTVIVKGNTIRDIVGCGICLAPQGPQDVTIAENLISDCGHEGIDVQTGVSAVITGNTLSGNRGKFVDDPQSIGGNGVVLNGSRASVFGNTFIDNNTGINCVVQGENSVGSNLFSGNDDDLQGESFCGD